ncbi:hypothetical protein GH714_018082 [Hevea brasiliensis]|uniref:Uncharacterized protein n=1 Tax=Hevea brasiliensis TaxID=3981 RepID=A0A6A6LMR0_HEVBR|nr:hypothetical protein GH714_018082 [Hevea brasiliensis]
MKSLVLSGNGCTVFDSNGHVVYRVDNYNCKSGNQVHLMDSWGNVLFTIFRKKFKLLGCWEGYKTSGSGADDERKPGFQVRKSFRLLRGGSLCRALVGLDQNQPSQYKIQSWTRNSTCRIIDDSGGLIAETRAAHHGVVTSDWLAAQAQVAVAVGRHSDDLLPSEPELRVAGKPFSVIDEFNNWRKQPNLAEAVAAIRALTAMIRNSEATTTMELEIEL